MAPAGSVVQIQIAEHGNWVRLKLRRQEGTVLGS
jgi:hypothetical protein